MIWLITHKQFELILRLKDKKLFGSSIFKVNISCFSAPLWRWTCCVWIVVEMRHLKTSFKDIFHHVIRLYWSDSWSINRERPTTLVFIRRQFSALVCILRRLQASSPFSGLIIKISLAVWSLQVADGPPASVQVPYGAFLKRRPVVRETESERRYSAWCKKTSRDRLEDYKRFLTEWKRSDGR